MKKIYILLMFVGSILLIGCFHKKEQPVEEQPQPTVIVDDNNVLSTGAVNTGSVDAGTGENVGEVDPSQPRDELDEDGAFDPTKFQDDDIDEVMNLLKELLAE